MVPLSDVRVHSLRKQWTQRVGRLLGRPVVAAVVAAVLTAGLCSACTPATKSPIERAEFGVLFGGQVQERTEIAFELDSSKQALGFVLSLNQPLPKPTTLHWELSKPGPLPASRIADPISRRVELFDTTVAAGQTQIQKTVNFEPGDSLGLWNIRVILSDQLALDRAFMVFDPSSRSRRVQEPLAVDAGL